MLQVVEYVDVYLVVCAFLLQKLSQGILYIVLVRQFQYRFVHCLAEPYHGLPDEFRSPFARPYKPRGNHPCQQARRIVVRIERDVLMFLEERCRAGRGDRTFHDILDRIGLVLAPGHENDFLGTHHGGDADGYGSLRGVGDIAVEIL